MYCKPLKSLIKVPKSLPNSHNCTLPEQNKKSLLELKSKHHWSHDLTYSFLLIIRTDLAFIPPPRTIPLATPPVTLDWQTNVKPNCQATEQAAYVLVPQRNLVPLSIRNVTHPSPLLCVFVCLSANHSGNHTIWPGSEHFSLPPFYYSLSFYLSKLSFFYLQTLINTTIRNKLVYVPPLVTDPLNMVNNIWSTFLANPIEKQRNWPTVRGPTIRLDRSKTVCNDWRNVIRRQTSNRFRFLCFSYVTISPFYIFPINVCVLGQNTTIDVCVSSVSRPYPPLPAPVINLSFYYDFIHSSTPQCAEI